MLFEHYLQLFPEFGIFLFDALEQEVSFLCFGAREGLREELAQSLSLVRWRRSGQSWFQVGGGEVAGPGARLDPFPPKEARSDPLAETDFRRLKDDLFKVSRFCQLKPEWTMSP
jgi:hypothetical protein